MNRLAHRVVTTERETDITHPAGDHRVGQGAFNLTHRIDEIHRVVVVLFDAGGNGENVGVKNNVFRRKANGLDQ